MNKATCRGCGARIVWIKTPAGKAMPCDPSPVYYKADPEGKDRIVKRRGEVVLIAPDDGLKCPYSSLNAMLNNWHILLVIFER